MQSDSFSPAVAADRGNECCSAGTTDGRRLGFGGQVQTTLGRSTPGLVVKSLTELVSRVQEASPR